MTPSINARPLRVAFADLAHNGWTAGAHYYRNLFIGLRALESSTPEIALLKWGSGAADRYESYECLVDRVLYAPPEPSPCFLDFWQRQTIRAQKQLHVYKEREPPEPVLAPFLRAQEIDSLFACWLEFGPRFTFPLLAWIPDFQHLHLPQLFPPEELTRRDQLFTRMAAHATRVIVSSEDARRDLLSFAPEAAAKARVLPFVAQVSADIYATDPSWICEHYHLPRDFFYLPDQFWQHKNHTVAVDALSLLKAKYPNLTVVCTGNTNDSRASLYFGELLARISRAGLREKFVILGWIPHAHIFQLMRQSLAVLQPSLFEGWSTTVEECKSLGKSLILSEIPVHREQNPPHAIFFDPHDPGSLAECLACAFEQSAPGPDLALEAEAQKQLPPRTRAFGQTFVEVAREVVLS